MEIVTKPLLISVARFWQSLMDIACQVRDLAMHRTKEASCTVRSWPTTRRFRPISQ